MGVLLDLFRGRDREPDYCDAMAEPVGPQRAAPVEMTPSDEATALFACPYCSAPAGTRCGIVPHQMRLDLLDVDAEALLAPHWLVSYGPSGEPLTEQCVCHMPYDHDELGLAAR